MWLPAILFFLAWVLFALYPEPADLVTSIYRVFRPPVDAEYARQHAHLFADLNETAEIDLRVNELFPYQYDWVTFGKPWYFPTVAEAFSHMAGDCKTRLVVLASVLDSRNTPYHIAVSPTHVWIEYDGKRESTIENAQVAFFATGGEQTLALPAQFDLRRSARSFWTAFWHYMPSHKKLSLAVGFVLALAIGLAGQVLSIVHRRSRLIRSRRNPLIAEDVSAAL
ncbi:MAG: hypothetical protein EA404_14700 [Spirochaetaceae bacterium]|nr:MAG: hypothetical protein EA404_14700 [Spirochaetaceae bacterium]